MLVRSRRYVKATLGVGSLTFQARGPIAFSRARKASKRAVSTVHVQPVNAVSPVVATIATMTTYKLRYFNVMGLGEPIRFLLSYGGIKFEDIRVGRDLNADEWTALKPVTPFGQLPTLEFNGKVYSQTLPICRYLAKQLNLLGKTDLDALEIDSVANALFDLRKQAALAYRESDPVKKEEKTKEVNATTIPFYLSRLEALAKSNGGYLHGGALSYADLFFVAISDSISTVYGHDITRDNPNLKSLKDKVLAIPNIKAWVEKRPKLEF